MIHSSSLTELHTSYPASHAIPVQFLSSVAGHNDLSNTFQYFPVPTLHCSTYIFVIFGPFPFVYISI
ncbi:hypothetical protein ABKN59_012010 [Abortiporus biennis]